MTKKKIIDTMLKRDSKGLVKFCNDGEYSYISDGKRGFRDKERILLDMEEDNTYLTALKGLFERKYVDDLLPAIIIPRTAVKEFLKGRRRQYVTNPNDVYIIDYGERFIPVDPWYLLEQLEFVKDDRIFITNTFNASGNYNGLLYSFSEDWESTQAITCAFAIRDKIEKERTTYRM